MKKILWLSILLSVLFASHAFAATPTLTVPAPTNNVITATLSNAPNFNIFQLIVQTTPFSTAPAPATNPTVSTTDPSLQTPNSQGVVTWSLTEKPVTTYYVRVLQISSLGNPPAYVGTPQTVTTGQPTLYYSHLSTTLQGSSIQITGAIDPVKQPNYASYNETLAYSTHADLSSPIQTTMPSVQDPSTPGKYYWLIPVSPNTTYYAQQTISLTGTNAYVTDPNIVSFDGGTGASMAANSPASNSLLNTQSYTLLSGFPGFSVLPDPTLCAREQAAGNPPKFCDINDVLNYFLNLMIGLCGVVLVFRLMFEGYQYMMTDVPFLKASSKGAFFTALGGLVLALSAYLILNTINPKLVSESTGITQLSIGVTEPDVDSAPLTSNAPAPASGTPVAACTGGITTVTVQQSSFIVCLTYNGIPFAANVKNMLTAAYTANIVLKGWSFRSDAEQIALRKAHCNGDLTNPKAVCNPPTAVPGHSNHESGLAIDFTCNGTGSYGFKNTPCFAWLQSNAGNYGLINYKAEPWHWSWNGS